MWIETVMKGYGQFREIEHFHGPFLPKYTLLTRDQLQYRQNDMQAVSVSVLVLVNLMPSTAFFHISILKPRPVFSLMHSQARYKIYVLGHYNNILLVADSFASLFWCYTVVSSFLAHSIWKKTVAKCTNMIIHKLYMFVFAHGMYMHVSITEANTSKQHISWHHCCHCCTDIWWQGYNPYQETL